MEKIHGTSAHVKYTRWHMLQPDIIAFSAGGENHERFVALFNEENLFEQFRKLFPDEPVEVTVYGEAYGGKCQGMSKTYGKELRFVVFEVKIGDCWLAVPDAETVTKALGLEFVHYTKIYTDMVSIDAERDALSVQAARNGMGEHIREGIVLRPLFELTKNNGTRIIAKHKRAEFCETASKREADPEKRQLLEDANAIAEEWVTEERLRHVLDKFNPEFLDLKLTGDVIKAMVEDVVREAGSEIMDTKEARKAIGARAAYLYKKSLETS